MTAKQIVIQKYPKAVSVKYPEDWGWCIFKKPPTTSPPKGALNLLSGYSEEEAWKEASVKVSNDHHKKGQK